MIFNINDYLGKYAMHCKTQDEARDFHNYMKSIGRPIMVSPRCCCGDNVSFFNKGTWDKKEYAEDLGYTILEWSDFMNNKFTKANLKTGDVIKRRNGWVEIVNLELGMLIKQTGWNNLDGVREDLTDTIGKEYDIVEVRRPITKGDCQFLAFEHGWGTLVYERPEVEEMTLAEVCRLLGKEIKIIK